MKKNVTILIGLVVIVAVLYGGSSFVKKSKGTVAGVQDMQAPINMKAFNGQVIREYEGQNVLEYGFDIPETATTSIGMDGALIKVTDTEVPIVEVYMSYEGGRGYTPIDYLTDVVAPHVAVINLMGTSTIGLYDWQVAESEGSEWRVAQVDSGKWLIVVENKKTVHDIADRILESVSAK